MPPRQNLYTQFLRWLLPLLAVAYALAAAITVGLYYQDQHATAKTQREQTLETFAQVLINPLWDCNSVTAHGIIHAITLQPSVLFASAPDQCAQKYIQSGSLPEHGNTDTLNTALNYIDELGRTHNLGELSIAFEPVSVFSAASRSLAAQLTLFLSILAAVLASALWTFKRTIGKPLKQLRQAMHQHETVDPVPENWTVELTEVTETYNTQLEKLRSQARHDPLTGLGNRLKLEEDLGRAIRRARRTAARDHVLLLDLDQFKSINDQFGHAAGDEVLRIVAQRLLSCVRDTDTVARLGGDEFVVVIADVSKGSDADYITVLTERLRHSLAQPIAWQNTFLHVDASIGLAQLIQDGNTIDELLAHADADMYRQKTQNLR